MKLRNSLLFATAIVILPLSSFAGMAMAQGTAKDWQHEVGESATAAREQWQNLTKGEELARGKAVLLSPKPNYRLTTDENDAYDLTDGTLSSRTDDRIWFNKDAVGWYLGAGSGSGALMVIDLGSEQPVGQIAIRVLAGREQGSLELPAAAEFLASADGKQYYSLQRMTKLMPAEKEQSDLKTGFYVPEEGKAFMYPLVCREPVKARFIALRVTPQSGLFTDQISVLKADATMPLKELTSFPTARVITDGLAVLPRQEEFVVTTNVATPNWITTLNNTDFDLTKSNSGFRLELPAGLRVLPQSQPAFKEVTATSPGKNAYQFSFDKKAADGPIWVEKEPDVTIPAGADVVFTGIVQGKDSHSLHYPLKLVEVPEVPALKNLDVSLAWLSDDQQQNWPNFLRDFRKMGFGFVSTFPRYFAKDANGQWNAATRKNLAFLEQARRDGYRIVYDESPFHVMWKAVETAQKAGTIDATEAEQLHNQVDGKPGKWMNPLYRGKFYRDEIARVAELAALVQPDHVYLDIEWWDESAAESKKDPRVTAAWKQSGKTWDDFITDIGTEILGDLVKTMRQAVPQRQLVVGLYNSDPKNKIYNSIFQWDKIYPGIVDIAQPSLYVQGRAQIVADRIGTDYASMKSRQIIPWLSAGTYGEFNSARMEPMIIESILNGSRGITYYWFGDFDPLDFYYHSKALATLAPFDTLLKEGKPLVYKGDNTDLHYSVFASDREALVLIGNYANSPKKSAKLILPQYTKASIVNGSPLRQKDGAFDLTVPAGEFRLIHLTK